MGKNKWTFVSFSKTKILSFGYPQYNFTMVSVSLEFVEDIKDLGLIINNKLICNSHIDLKLAKSNKTFNVLRRNVPFQVKQLRKLLLDRSLILSVLLFTSIAWSHSVNSLRLESFQKRVLKWVSNSNDYDKCLQIARNLFVLMSICYGKTGTKKIDITVELELIKSTSSTRSASKNQFAFKPTRRFESDNKFFIKAVPTAKELIKLNILNFESTLPIFSRDLKNHLVQKRASFNLYNSCTFVIKCFC